MIIIVILIIILCKTYRHHINPVAHLVTCARRRKVSDENLSYEPLFLKVLLLCTICFTIVPSLTLANIISTHHVYSQSECAFDCLIKDGCVGFKHKPCINTESGSCQLSNTTGEQNNLNIEDKGWIFFIDVKNKPVRK